MFHKILRRLGLVRALPTTNEDVVNTILVDYLFSVSPSGPLQERFPEESMAEVRDIFTKHPVLKDFFDWTIMKDVHRFYSAHDSEHPMIRGAISRTRYFRTLCLPPGEKGSMASKLDIKRYIQNI